MSVDTLERSDEIDRVRTSQICFSSPIAREVVHRAAASEVFLTDISTNGSGALCGAQWPLGHRIFYPHRRRHDTLLTAETLRQTGIALLTPVLAVPADFRVLLDRLRVSADATAMRTGAGPAEILIEADIALSGRPTKNVRGFYLRAVFRRGHTVVATGEGWGRAVHPAVYARLRGQRRTTDPVAVPPPATEAATVGAGFVEDVALGPEVGAGWQLRVQPDHPLHFDHPLDHVPGMLVLEAFRQACRLHLAEPTGWVEHLDLRAHRFVELDERCEVRVAGRAPGTRSTSALNLELRQGAVVAASASLGLHRDCSTERPTSVAELRLPGPREER